MRKQSALNINGQVDGLTYFTSLALASTIELFSSIIVSMIATRLLLAFVVPLVSALKFDIQAHPGAESASKERCIRNFVAREQLVVVTATVGGSRGDGQTLNMHVGLVNLS